MSSTDGVVHVGKANIFEELGLPDAEGHFLKAKIVAELYRLSQERGLTQTRTGLRLGISQPEVSRLFKGHFREYSVERLMGFLTAFDQDVEIVTRPKGEAADRGVISFRKAG